MIRASLTQIEKFLSNKRLAFLGVSRNKSEFSRALFREFAKRGYEVIPVNPYTDQVENIPCIARVKDIKPQVDAAILLTSPDVTSQLIFDCVGHGIKMLWLYNINEKDAVTQDALQYCNESNVTVISGECPFMFFEKPGFAHWLHGSVRKIFGSYPA